MQKVKTIFVGDVDVSLSETAIAHDSQAFLVSSNNYAQFIAETDAVTGYTCLGDLPKDTNVFWDILNSVEQIVYAPPEKWKNNPDNSNLYCYTDTEQGLTELFLMEASKNITTLGLENVSHTHVTLDIADTRNTSDKQIWLAGCSNTVGLGVEHEQTYGYKLAQSLNLPYTMLAHPGTSNAWSADQILRSDIQKGDLVVWGLTNSERISWYENGELITLLSTMYVKYKHYEKILPSKYLVSEMTLHQGLAGIAQVANFCSKIGAQLVLFCTYPTDHSLVKYLYDKPYFHHIDFDFEIDKKTNEWHLHRLDTGTDDHHPGSRHHQYWHDKLLEIIDQD